MKILAIRLKNLASIEGSFEVDFTAEPLRSAGIFAISGPTGAGKSTILDALCLALYDKTPRFAASGESLYLADVGDSQVNQSDVKNILRRGTGEGFAEVDFLGATGRKYRSHWSVRRARGKATGSLQAQTMQVFDLDKEEELQGTKTELLGQLVGLIGLTYEQFTRTVLLAQNDFATFLKSRESAKAELLEKLTGTEIYSRISREVYQRSKSADEAVNVLKSTVSLIEILPEEELQALLEERVRRTALRDEGTKRLAGLNAQMSVIRTLKIQQEQLSGKRKEEVSEAEKLQKLKEGLDTQIVYLTRFHEQWEALQPELHKARELDARLQAVQLHYKQSEQSLQQARQQTAALKKKYNTAKGSLDALCRSMNHLLKDDSLIGLPLPELLKEAEHILLKNEGHLAGLQKENDVRVEKLNAFNIRSVSEEQTRLLQLQARVQRALPACTLLIELLAKKDRLLVELSGLMRQLEAKQGQVSSLQWLYENARMAMSKDVAALRQNLHDDEACPVCGSTSHPYRQGGEVADTLFHSIEKEYKEVSDAYKLLNDKGIALQQDIRNAEEQQKVQEELLTSYSAEERSPEYLSSQLDNLRHKLAELDDKMKQYEVLYAEWQRQDAILKNLRTYCESLRTELTQSHLLMQQITSVGEQLEMAGQTENKEQTRFNAAREELEQLQQQRAALLKGKSVEDAESAVRRKEKELNEGLEVLRKQVETANARISGLQGEMKQLSVAIAELTQQQQQIENPAGLTEAIVACETANRENERNLATVEARVLQQEQNRKRLKDIEIEWQEKQLVAEKWGKLNKLIGSADGTKFKVIAQSYTLNLLLLHANKHLSYLSKRYKLQQVPATLALQVIDRDMCDEIRTVYSLSGGESFLISLALALGLSSLSSNNLKVESLFIDEGFGSLDADSLRTAMEALEQLQMQGRKIGVISHVQEMSERISVQVQLHKLVNGKSEIRVIAM